VKLAKEQSVFPILVQHINLLARSGEGVFLCLEAA
jgi:hypothetical protein